MWQGVKQLLFVFTATVYN